MNKVFPYKVLPQFYDFDPLQIVHNVVYLRWLEDARTDFLNRSPWPLERCWAADLSPAVTATEIRYQRPIRFGDRVSVRLWGTRAGKSAWGLAFEFVQPETGVVFASGEQSGCFVKPSDGRPVRMPSEFLIYCQDFLKGTADTPGD